MKNWIKYLTPILCLAIFSGCQRIDEGEQIKGGLSLTLSSSNKTIAGVNATQTKADEGPLYAINIIRTATEELVEQFPDHTQLPTSINLSQGEYTVEAVSGDKNIAQFEKASYFGETQVTIQGGKTTNASIEAEITNVVFTTSFNELINENFTKADLLIYTQEGGELLFTIPKEDQGRLAYLPVHESYYWVLAVTNTQGSQYMLDGKITEAQVRYRYDFHFAISSENTESEGVQKFEMTIDRNLVESEHSIEISSQAGSGASPVVEGEGIVVGQPIYVNSVLRNTQARYNIKVAANTSEFWFFHEIQILEDKGIPKAVNLKEADEQMRAKLEEAGIQFSQEINNQGELFIDYTNFCNSPNTPLGTYVSRFSVTDNIRQYTIQPVLIEVLPDQDHIINTITCEAMFATINAEWLTLEKSETLSIEYKTESEENWTRVEQEDLVISAETKKYSTMLHRLAPSTKYLVRSYSDEKLGKEFSFTTKAKVDIPNLDFQTWSKGGGGGNAFTGREDSWYPNSSATNKNSFWVTGNEGTAMYQAAKKSITYPDEDATYGKVVKMESIWISSTFAKTFAAGNIFTGYFAVNTGDPLMSAKMGRPYAGRPLGLKGRYKYVSKVIDCNAGGGSFDQYKGQDDQGNIYIRLENWGDGSIQPESFGSGNVPSGVTKVPIGLGNLIIDDSNGEWVEFYLPVDYSSDAIPTHITMAASSSLRGENFCGAKGSTLWVSGFELVWDPLDIPSL